MGWKNSLSCLCSHSNSYLYFPFRYIIKRFPLVQLPSVKGGWAASVVECWDVIFIHEHLFMGNEISRKISHKMRVFFLFTLFLLIFKTKFNQVTEYNIPRYWKFWKRWGQCWQFQGQCWVVPLLYRETWTFSLSETQMLQKNPCRIHL